MTTKTREHFFTMSYPGRTTIDRIGGDIRRALRVRRSCQVPTADLVAALGNGRDATDQDLTSWLNALRLNRKIVAHAYPDGRHLFERLKD